MVCNQHLLLNKYGWFKDDEEKKINEDTLKKNAIMFKLLFTGASVFLGSQVKPLLHSLSSKDDGLLDEDNYKVNLATTSQHLQEKFDVYDAAGKLTWYRRPRVRRKLF